MAAKKQEEQSKEEKSEAVEIPTEAGDTEALKAMEKVRSSAKELECTSCKIRIAGAREVSRFPCPQCGNEIIRCGKCRRIVSRYVCPKCEFEGPN